MGRGGAPWIFAINGNDLPISFTFVDHAQNTQHFDRPHFALHCVYHCIYQHERTGNTLIAYHCIYQHQRTCIVYINMRERTWDRAWVQAQTTHRYTSTHIYLHHGYTIHHTYIYTRTQVQDSIFTNIQTHKYICTIRTYTPAHMYTFEYLHTHTQENHSVSSLYTQESHVCRQIDTHTYIDTHTRQTHIHTYHLIIAHAIEVVTSIYGGSLTYILRHINSPTPSPLEIDRYTHTQTHEP